LTNFTSMPANPSNAYRKNITSQPERPVQLYAGALLNRLLTDSPQLIRRTTSAKQWCHGPGRHVRHPFPSGNDTVLVVMIWTMSGSARSRSMEARFYCIGE
jgi:hypothetical protein